MSNDKKVNRVPSSYDKKMKSQKGSGYVPCGVSGRYIMFDDFIHENGFVCANVWSSNGEKDRKICDLVLTYDDLVSAIKNMTKHVEECEDDDFQKAKQLIPKINEIIGIAEEYHTARENEDPYHNNIRYAIAQAMRHLGTEGLHIIEAIMYIGRDDYISPDNYESLEHYYQEKEYLQSNYNPEESLKSMVGYLIKLQKHDGDIIDNMLSKRPLANYLKRGLDVLGLQRI
ncbi:hypothetical protein [Paenibacillus dendritiformis]|uniref:hypothetical protein n=1 Tax=Paenibacillus dendritiformis TaxID=130049 RepID=UPI00387E1822